MGRDDIKNSICLFFCGTADYFVCLQSWGHTNVINVAPATGNMSLAIKMTPVVSRIFLILGVEFQRWVQFSLCSRGDYQQ